MKRIAKIFPILVVALISFSNLPNSIADNTLDFYPSAKSENSIYVDSKNFYENEATVAPNGVFNKSITVFNLSTVTQTIDYVIIEQYRTTQGNHGWRVQEGSTPIKELLPKGTAKSKTLDLLAAYKGNIPAGTHTFLVGYKQNGILNYYELATYILQVYNLDGTMPLEEAPPLDFIVKPEDNTKGQDLTSSTGTKSPTSSSASNSKSQTSSNSTSTKTKLTKLTISGKNISIATPKKGSKSVTFTIKMSNSNIGKVDVKRINKPTKVLCKVSFKNKKVAKCVYKITKKTKKETIKFKFYYTPNNKVYQKVISKQYTLKIK